MANGLMHYIRKAWKKPDIVTLRKRMTEWRAADAIVRVERPLRLDRAKALGYSAKPGIVVLRVKLMRGGRRSPARKAGRRSKRKTNRLVLKMSYQGVAEQRAARKYPNLEVLNSYWVGKDGMYFYYEVIMVDPENPHIKADKKLNWVASGSNRNRVFRGLTSAGRRSRGLYVKGRDAKF